MTNEKTFSCSYQEWAFSQAFNRLEGMTKSKTQIKKDYIEWIGLAILFFLLIVAGSFYDFFGWLVYVVIAYSISKLIKYGLANGRQKLSIERTRKAESINYMIVDHNGLYINNCNKDIKENMVFISWKNIEQIDFYYTTYYTRKYVLHNHLIEHGDWIPNLTDTFDFSEKSQFSLYFYDKKSTSPKLSIYQFQLPSSWLKTNTFRKLAEEVKANSNTEIKPLDVSRINVGLLKSDSFEVENQNYLNTVYTNALHNE